MGFIIHFYIIFGTNLLTGGPAQIVVFLPISVFEETEYQTESKRNETFGIVIFQPNVTQETWTLLQGVKEEVTRVEGAPRGVGVPASSWPPRLFLDVHSKSPGSRCSKNHAPEGFIPFGLRLIFFFCETLK